MGWTDRAWLAAAATLVGCSVSSVAAADDGSVMGQPAKAAVDAVDTVDAPAPVAQPQRAKVAWIEASAGLGTPIGWAGGSLVARPSDVVAVSAGGGWGTQGPQVAVGARAVVIPGRRVATALGAAWSMGTYAGIDGGFFIIQSDYHPPIRYWERAHFANAEVSFEPTNSRARVWHLRPFAGLGVVVNQGDAVCSANGYSKPCGGLGAIVPYVGMAATVGVL